MQDLFVGNARKHRIKFDLAGKEVRKERYDYTTQDDNDINPACLAMWRKVERQKITR